MKYEATSFPIAREAWVFAIPVLIAMILCVVYHMMWSAVLLLVLLIYVLAFFRNPHRVSTSNPTAIIAPADGKIVSAAIVSQPDFETGQALRIAIFMNIFNVHVNWSPIDGKVERAEYFPGKFINAMEDKCGEENERKLLWMRARDGSLVLVKLIAGLIARRIVCPVDKGDALEKGEKIGLIRFGSRVEVILPATCALQVACGTFVRGGETVIAILPANESRIPEGDSPEIGMALTAAVE
jgi:phosphatidylserine decarboxylase